MFFGSCYSNSSCLLLNEKEDKAQLSLGVLDSRDNTSVKIQHLAIINIIITLELNTYHSILTIKYDVKS